MVNERKVEKGAQMGANLPSRQAPSSGTTTCVHLVLINHDISIRIRTAVHRIAHDND
jgi:hypothetical protein